MPGRIRTHRVSHGTSFLAPGCGRTIFRFVKTKNRSATGVFRFVKTKNRSATWLFSTAEARTSNSSSSSYKNALNALLQKAGPVVLNLFLEPEILGLFLEPVGSGGGLTLHRALRRMAGLVFLLVFWALVAGACQSHGVGGFLLCNSSSSSDRGVASASRQSAWFVHPGQNGFETSV